VENQSWWINVLGWTLWGIIQFILVWISLEISIFWWMEGYGWINPDKVPGIIYYYIETGKWPSGGMADALTKKNNVSTILVHEKKMD
jgi:hypothetical protein